MPRGLLFLFACSLAFAQLPTGTILGVVQDTTGAVVAGAQITVTDRDTGLTRAVTTEGDGSYRLPALPVGGYRIEISHEGFKRVTRTGLTLAVSQEAVVNVTLEVGSSQQTVEVMAEAPAVNTTNATVGSLVNEQKLQDLPLNGRNLVGLTLLQPGVSRTSVAGVGGIVYSVNGAPIRSNAVLIDGATMTTTYGAQVTNIGGSNLGVDGVREYRVVTNSFGPEYGMVMGSVTTIVSKGGSNQFHGDAFDYLRNSAMDARGYFDSPPALLGRRIPLYQRNQFGGAFGGPIKKDRAFFYGVYEQLKDNLNVALRPVVPAAACHTPAVNGVQTVDNIACLNSRTAGTTTVQPAIQPLLALFPNPNLPGNIYSWTFPQKTNEYYGQMRFDQNISTRDSLFARYTSDYEDQPNPGNYPTIGIQWESKSRFATVSENHIFSPSFLSQARASFSRTNIVFAYDTDLVGPQYSFNPGYGVGTINVVGLSSYNPPSPPFWDVQSVYTLSDDMFWTKGKHSFKFGTLLNEFNNARTTYSNTIGLASFGSLAGFLAGTPTTYTMSAVTAEFAQNRNYHYSTAGFYFGDDYRLSPRLTLNLGLRYEFWTVPQDSGGRNYALHDVAHDTRNTVVHGDSVQNPSYKNFSPRFGFAWDVTGKATTSIKGGGGIYYDIATVQNAFIWGLNAMPPLAGLNSVSCTPVCSTPINVPFTFPAGSLGATVNLVDYYARQPYMIQWNLSLEHRFPGDFVVNAGYVGTRGVHLWQSKQVNPVLPTSITKGVPFWDPSVLAAREAAGCTSVVPTCRQNPNFGTMTAITNQGDSFYNGLQITLSKRLGHGLQFQANYVRSRAEDDSQGILADGSGQITDVLFTKRYDWGPSPYDVTNNFRANLLYNVPGFRSSNFFASLTRGWWLSSIIGVQSGAPFSPTLGFNPSLSGISDRAAYVTSANLATAKVFNPNAVVYDPDSVIIGIPGRWFNANMFTVSPPGLHGDVPRNTLRGPGLQIWDFSLNKNTPIRQLGEGGNLQFRAEVFNLMNHPNFGMPNATAAGSTGITATAGLINSIAAGSTARQVQLALKLIF